MTVKPARNLLIATGLALSLCGISLANYSASFKEVAEMGGSVVLARCVGGQPDVIKCRVLEVWRGKRPKNEIAIPHDEWAYHPVGGLEKQPDARFLLVINENGEVDCMSGVQFRGMKIPPSGDVGTCVVPVLDGKLPSRFRKIYDHTDGPELTIPQLKADLLSPAAAR